MKKILIINSSLTSGSGVERSMITILEALDKKKYDITLFVNDLDTTLLPLVPKEVKVIVDHDDTHYYKKPYALILYAFELLFKAWKLEKVEKKAEVKIREYIHNEKVKRPLKVYFKNEYFDAVLANTLPALCLERALTIRSEKKFAVFHSSKADFFPQLTLTALQKCDKVVAVSEGVGEVLKEAYKEYADKVTVISNYVNAEEIKRLSEAPVDDMPETNGTVLATCGRISHEKGYDLAVEAAKKLKQSNIDFTWLFIGDGSDRAQISDSVTENGLDANIVLIGNKVNPFPYINACDIYVQPSYEESYCLTLKEAQVLGKAIVSTDTVGGRTILEGGKKGIITPVSAEGIYEGIMKLIEDPEYRSKYENLLTSEDNNREKQAYIEKYNELSD